MTYTHGVGYHLQPSPVFQEIISYLTLFFVLLAFASLLFRSLLFVLADYTGHSVVRALPELSARMRALRQQCRRRHGGLQGNLGYWSRRTAGVGFTAAGSLPLNAPPLDEIGIWVFDFHGMYQKNLNPAHTQDYGWFPDQSKRGVFCLFRVGAIGASTYHTVCRCNVFFFCVPDSSPCTRYTKEKRLEWESENRSKRRLKFGWVHRCLNCRETGSSTATSQQDFWPKLEWYKIPRRRWRYFYFVCFVKGEHFVVPT